MPFDAHQNLAISAVTVAPSPPLSGGSLSVTAGEGARFPPPPFNATVFPASSIPTPANAEIVRVTARTTDTFTITRIQEGTSARAIQVGDLLAATVTAKTITDIETALDGQGQWIDVPYNPANYQGVNAGGSGAAVWTVDPGDLFAHAYARINKMLWVNFVVNGTSLSVPDFLKIPFPAGFVPTRQSVVFFRCHTGGAAGERLGLSYNSALPAAGPYIINLTGINMSTGASELFPAGTDHLTLQLMALYGIQ